MRQATFPESFSERPHPVGFGAQQWILLDANGEIIVSVVNGPRPFFYCGPDTFEVWDFVGNPEGYLTKDDINEYLKERGLTEPPLTDDMVDQIKPGDSVNRWRPSTSGKTNT